VNPFRKNVVVERCFWHDPSGQRRELPACAAKRDAKRPGVQRRGTCRFYQRFTQQPATFRTPPRSAPREAPTNADLRRFKSNQGRQKPASASVARKPNPRSVRRSHRSTHDAFGSVFGELGDWRPPGAPHGTRRRRPANGGGLKSRLFFADRTRRRCGWTTSRTGRGRRANLTD